MLEPHKWYSFFHRSGTSGASLNGASAEAGSQEGLDEAEAIAALIRASVGTHCGVLVQACFQTLLSLTVALCYISSFSWLSMSCPLGIERFR